MAQATKKYSENLEDKIISLVRDEKEKWEDPTAFVTPKVAFNMRNLIERLRKNYYGIFDTEIDPVTGLRKTWVPLTESIVDSVVKNIDLDSKDIGFRALNPKAIGLTGFVRTLVRNRLDSINFGDSLDKMERSLAIDGTVVWKTYRTDHDGKKAARISQVDLLNFYIDPIASSIQEAYSVIERAVLTKADVKSMTGWMNTDDVQTGSYNRNNEYLNGDESNDDLVEVFERWGLMPKSFITGKKSDEDKLVEGHIVISGLDDNARIHLVEENENKDSSGRVVKPYEECWYKRVPGRWHGRGVAEMVMMMQLWINTIVNIRINRSRVSQLGLFKVRKGSNITPQQLNRLPASGAIVVNNPDDIVQMAVQDASPASYQDENIASGWAERVTSAFEAITGEQLPASTPATNAVIQNRMAQSQFVMVKEGIGMFLERWMQNHFIPAVAATITKGEIVAMEGKQGEMTEEKIANYLIAQKLEELKANNQFVPPERVQAEKKKIVDKLKARGPQYFIKIMEKPDLLNYKVEVIITNEEIDKSVAVKNLVSVLQMVGQVPGIDVNPTDIAMSIFDMMGLDVRQFQSGKTIAPVSTPPQVQASPQGPQEPIGPKEAQTDQALTTAANTL